MEYRLRQPPLASVAGVLAVICISLGCYDPREFKGVRPMQDDGFFSYYRYHAPIGEVPLNVEGSYEFPFSGLPDDKMGLQLHVPVGSTPDMNQFARVSTAIVAEIVDATGNRVCMASGTPAGKNPSDRWVLMSSAFDAAFWHDDCRDKPFTRHMSYTLRMRVQNVDPASPSVMMVAMLEGGGHELP
jgi:hypothetical protein